MAELAAKAREEMSARRPPTTRRPEGTIAALPSPPRGYTPAPPPEWADLDVDPADLVVIVGGAELGPYGSSRTRFEMEVDNELSAAGVLELAWTTGLIRWEDDPQPGWYDTQSGDLVDEAELVERYHDTVVERCGIREFVDDGAIDPDHASPLLVSVFLDKDFAFVVSSEADARAFVEFDPEHTVIRPVPDSSDWQVIRKAGTEIRVPRKTKLSRVVGGQIPTGFDPTVWGISPDMASSIDRVAVWNIVATVDAFLTAGFSPAEVMRYVHPSLVANTMGTGMGGGTSMQTMYHGNLLGRNKPNDIFQEVLPNIVAAHVVQSYIGSYGAMIHPVAACATAAVSVEEGVDKIRLGKAELVVAGGIDDLTLEGIIGFGDMAATADTAMMRGRGIHDSKFSRPNDRRRLGFVEAQGGGTILLARGDLALKMGLPVLAVVAFAQSFGDGVHTSIPAPGLGALGAGRGGKDSPLARALAKLGVGADDIAVISKHDTSTLANDPNETELHERLADSLGRSEGAPLFVVSQKSLTGHAKGGAAVFQMMGLCQMLRDGVIPPNRSLDCVDDELAGSAHFVWVRDTLRLGGKFPLKAGMLTSLGFGHVSGLVALVHPQAFIASLDPEQRADYQRRADARLLAGQRRLVSAIAGGEPMYQRPPDRRFDHECAGEASGGCDAAESGPLGWVTTRPTRSLPDDFGHPLTWPAMGIVGVGIDLVSIPDFAEQVDQPGTVFSETFTPGERRDASDKSSSAARHLAARWAAKEAVIKAWSGSRFAQRPVLRGGHPPRHRSRHRHVGTTAGAVDRGHRQASGRRDDPRVADPRRGYRGRGGHPRNGLSREQTQNVALTRDGFDVRLCVCSRRRSRPTSLEP